MSMVIIYLVIKNDYCSGVAMYVCICNSVSDKAIKKAVKQGHDTLGAIQEELNVGTCCGRCKGHACEVIEEALNPEGFEFNLMQGVYA